MTPEMLKIAENTRIRPEGGWRENTFYIVEVAFDRNNVIHKALFFTGFLSESGAPSGYNEILQTEGRLKYQDTYYLKPIIAIANEDFDLLLDPAFSKIEEDEAPLCGNRLKNIDHCRCEGKESTQDCGCAFGQCQKGLIY